MKNLAATLLVTVFVLSYAHIAHAETMSYADTVMPPMAYWTLMEAPADEVERTTMDATVVFDAQYYSDLSYDLSPLDYVVVTVTVADTAVELPGSLAFGGTPGFYTENSLVVWRGEADLEPSTRYQVSYAFDNTGLNEVIGGWCGESDIAGEFFFSTPAEAGPETAPELTSLSMSGAEHWSYGPQVCCPEGEAICDSTGASCDACGNTMFLSAIRLMAEGDLGAFSSMPGYHLYTLSFTEDGEPMDAREGVVRSATFSEIGNSMWFEGEAYQLADEYCVTLQVKSLLSETEWEVGSTCISGSDIPNDEPESFDLALCEPAEDIHYPGSDTGVPTDVSDVEPGVVGEDDCSCTVSRRPSGAPLGVLLALGAFLVLARRRHS